MRVLSLVLDQFRSFDHVEMDTSDVGSDLLIGLNGSGKTNILEALSFASLGASCLGAPSEDVIRWEKEFARVRVTVQQDDGEEKSLEVTMTIAPRKAKAFFVNDVRVPTARFLGILPSVTFLPEDLLLFSGSPALRRTFLDRILMQVSLEFTHAFTAYKKALTQRNILLRRIAKEEARERDLDPWDTQLAEFGAIIVQERKRLLKALNASLSERVQALGEKWPSATMIYQSKSIAMEQGALREELSLQLAHYRPRDLLVHSTTVGPHRDDWFLEAREHSIAHFASRGQQRTALLAILFAVVSYIGEIRSEKPIILLDDVFSELDEAHQHALLFGLDDHHVFMSTTHLPEEVSGMKVWEVREGTVYQNTKYQRQNAKQMVTIK